MKHVTSKVDYREHNLDFPSPEIDDFLYCIERLNFLVCHMKVMSAVHKLKTFDIFKCTYNSSYLLIDQYPTYRCPCKSFTLDFNQRIVYHLIVIRCGDFTGALGKE